MKLFLLTFFIFSFTYAQEEACLDPNLKPIPSGSEALTLATQITDATLPTFSTPFCEALTACDAYTNEMAAKLVAAEYLNHFNNALEAQKKNLELINVYKKLEVPAEKEEVLQALLSYLEKKQKRIELFISAYETYAKDIIHNDPPEDTFSTFFITDLEIAENTMKTKKAIFEMQLKQDLGGMAQKNLEVKKAELAQQEGATSEFLKFKKLELEIFENSMKSSLLSLDDYKAYLKDPKVNPFPLENYYTPAPPKETKPKVNSEDICKLAHEIYKQTQAAMVKNKAGSCGLTPEELVSMTYYTESGYACMNNYLRQKEQTSSGINLILENLNKGLKKLPNYRGIVRRGTELPDEVRDQHKAGSIVEYKSYTSTSTEEGFMGKDMFMIFSKTGKPIMSFSDYDGEKEILFPPGMKFKVLDVSEKGSSFVYVLKEVSPDDSEEEDQKILSEIHIQKDTPKTAFTFKGDSWMCPEDVKAVLPLDISQILMPVVRD